MKRLLLSVLLILIGTGSGVGVGLFLESSHAVEMAEGDQDIVQEAGDHEVITQKHATEREYAKLNNQFIVPVVQEGHVTAMVILSLSLEVVAGGRSAVFEKEPKLRDAFLQAMFGHANLGGFSGNFTSGENMHALRNELLRQAQNVAGDQVTDVLIIDIVRQDS